MARITDRFPADELDSHLYQSVGTSVLPHLARAMSLPLFTRVIKGKAVARGAEYGDRTRGGEGSGQAGDETEDLTMLLRQVLVSVSNGTHDSRDLRIRKPTQTLQQ
jgi:diphthine-ammonia ligase